jgi:hypothetical protein
MGYKPKSRCVVTFDGNWRELFAIRVRRTDDSLVLMMKSALNAEFEGQSIPLSAERFSIHNSPDSPGMTITRHTILADNREIMSAQFVVDAKDLLVPIYTSRSAFLGDRYASKANARDDVYNIGTFRTADRTSLIHTVVVAVPSRELPRDDSYLAKTVIRFAKYQIGVYSSYFNLPAGPFGDVLFTCTNPQTLDRVPFGVGPEEPGGMDSYTDEKLLEHLGWAHEEAGRKLVQRIMAADPANAEAISGWPIHLCVSPEQLAAARAALVI